MGKEAASLYIAVRLQAKQAQKDLKDLYSTARGEAASTTRVVSPLLREQIRLDGLRAREAAKTQREVSRSLLLEEKNVQQLMRTKHLAWQQELREMRERERQQRRSGPKPSALAQAIYTSRFNAGGGASPLVGRTLDALGMARNPLMGSGLLLGGMLASELAKGADLAGNLEQSLNVLQVTSKATDKQLDALRKTARELGADVTLPATSSLDAAKAMLELSKGGLEVKETQDAARGALTLAAAAQIDAAAAAKINVTQLKAFNLEGKESARIADLLAATANASASDIGDLAEAAQQSSASFAASKQPIEDMYTALGLLANAGIRGSDAGTSLKTMMSRLLPTTREAKEAMKALGVETYDAQGNMLPLRDIIAQFSRVLPTLTQKQRDFAVQTIFGSDAQRAANVILAAGAARYDDLKKKVTESGAAAKLAEAQTKGYKGALEGLRSAHETFLEKAGSPFLGFLTEGTKLLTAFVGGFDDWIGKTREATGVNLSLTESLKAINETIELNRKTAEQDATLQSDPRKRNTQERIGLSRLRDYNKELAGGGSAFSFLQKASREGTFSEVSDLLDRELGPDRGADSQMKVGLAIQRLKERLDNELRQLQAVAKVTDAMGVAHDPYREAFDAEGKRRSSYIGQITDYGQQNDRHRDSNSLRGIGIENRRLIPGRSLAVSPDVEDLFKGMQIKPGDTVELTLSSGKSITVRWDDRTASDKVAAKLGLKPLRGRYDIYSPGGKSPLDGTPVVNARKGDKSASAAIADLMGKQDRLDSEKAQRRAEVLARRAEQEHLKTERLNQELARLKDDGVRLRASALESTRERQFKLDLDRLQDTGKFGQSGALTGELIGSQQTALLRQVRQVQAAAYTEADARYTKDSKRQVGDTAAIAQARQERAAAERDAAKQKADDEFRKKEEDIRQAILGAQQRMADIDKELADRAEEDAQRRAEAQIVFLRNEGDILESDRSLVDAQDTASLSAQGFAQWFAKREQLAKLMYQNTVEQLQAQRDAGLRELQARAARQYSEDVKLMGPDAAYKRWQQTLDVEGRRIGSTYEAGLTGATNQYHQGVQDTRRGAIDRRLRSLFGYNPLASPAAFLGLGGERGNAPTAGPLADVVATDEQGGALRGMNRFARDPKTGLLYDTSRWNQSQSGQTQVDSAQVFALQSLASSGSRRTEGLFKGLLAGDGSALKEFFQGLGQDLGDTAAEALRQKLIDGWMERLFDKQADKLAQGGEAAGENIGKGGKSAADFIGQAASLMLIALNLSGKQGKKKQLGTLVGGAIGFAAGGWAGAQLGALVGGTLTPRAGGGPMLPGRSYLFEGDRPEVVRIDGAGGRAYASGGMREVAGGGGMHIEFHGPIHERSDAEYIVREIEDRRRREARLR